MFEYKFIFQKTKLFSDIYNKNMNKIKLINLIKELLESDDENFKRYLSDDRKNKKIIITGFTEKLSVERVKKYLDKYGLKTIGIDDITIIKSDKTVGQIKTLLQNAYGKLSDNLIINEK